MSNRETQPRTRYSCQEAREDSELVLSDRATVALRERYDEHLRGCRDCRRVHRALYAVYEGPAVPAAAAGLREEKEFHAILRRMKTERPDPWYRRWAVGATVGGLASAAAVLTLTLFDVAPEALSLPPSDDETQHQLAGAFGGSTAEESSDSAEGGIDHPAQSYGRVVGGLAIIVPPGEQAASSNTFPVGTRFSVDPDQSLQVGLVGKIVANFTPSSEIEWTAASPSLIELQVDRGIAAVRYDRRASDPVLQIRTPTAVVRVIGTVFTVEVQPDSNTIVSVLRGQVEVLHPKTNRLLAEVESGFRYDVAKSTFDDPGKTEVEAALPLSNDHGKEDAAGVEVLSLADGRIPAGWNVPGLPEDPRFRTVDYVPARASESDAAGTTIARGHRPGPTVVVGTQERETRQVDDDGEDIIARLARDAELTRRKELRGALESCRGLYESVETRYLAAKCLSTFIDKYGDDPLAVEGYLLVGILRMDYALDYDAAEVAFQTFLRRAPNHASAEVALYRMLLSSTENGRISEALARGRKYLQRYPNGKYVGKVLQRFPELKSEL
jgi:FecR protein